MKICKFANFLSLSLSLSFSPRGLLWVAIRRDRASGKSVHLRVLKSTLAPFYINPKTTQEEKKKQKTFQHFWPGISRSLLCTCPSSGDHDDKIATRRAIKIECIKSPFRSLSTTCFPSHLSPCSHPIPFVPPSPPPLATSVC